MSSCELDVFRAVLQQKELRAATKDAHKRRSMLLKMAEKLGKRKSQKVLLRRKKKTSTKKPGTRKTDNKVLKKRTKKGSDKTKKKRVVKKVLKKRVRKKAST